jgi:glycosyltransferase involved in cell wall biosynthesis
VVPAYGDEARIDAVLKALSYQTYPRTLFDVIVADDGTDPPLQPTIPDGLTVSLVWQADEGFRAGAARNLGALNASGDVLVFLDSDILPEPDWLLAHMRLHHQCPWLLVCGFRRHVAIERIGAEDLTPAGPRLLFRGHEFREPEWIVDFWRNHNNGRSSSDQLWRMTSSGNLSITTRAFWAIGGFDEVAFVGWGGEDNDFGYRAYQAGVMVIPEPRAMGWHLGWGTYSSDDISALRRDTRLLLASRIPDRGLPSLGALSHVVPNVWLRLNADLMVLDEAIRLCADCLSARDPVAISLIIRNDAPLQRGALVVLSADSRVHVGPVESAPAAWFWSPIHVDSAKPDWTSGDLESLSDTVREGTSGEVRVIHDDDTVSIARLTRLKSQVDRGLISDTSAFFDYGGRWVAKRDLASRSLPPTTTKH